jgi:hypothetical protein
VPYPRPRKILAIDPGERAGVSTYIWAKDERFVLDAAWEVAGGTVASVAGVVQAFAVGGPKQTAMVLERQFMKWREGAGGATKGHETLLYRRHIWQILAEVFKVPVALVYPISWSSKMLPKKDLPPGDEDADTKARARMACLARWPDRKTLWDGHENARDAALIGRFYADLVEERLAIA